MPTVGADLIRYEPCVLTGTEALLCTGVLYPCSPSRAGVRNTGVAIRPSARAQITRRGGGGCGAHVNSKKRSQSL